MANKDALKVAVIGGGHIAQQHLPVLRDLPEAALVFLVEKQPQTLQETADRFAIPRRFSSHLELLERDRLDAVFVLVSVLQVAAVAAACPCSCSAGARRISPLNEMNWIGATRRDSFARIRLSCKASKPAKKRLFRPATWRMP